MPDYRERLVDPLLTELLAELPAVSLIGSRASGKTTTAERHAQSVFRLGEPRQAEAISTDPDAVLQGLKEPVLVTNGKKHLMSWERSSEPATRTPALGASSSPGPPAERCAPAPGQGQGG